MALEARAKLQNVKKEQTGQKQRENTSDTTTCRKPVPVADAESCGNIGDHGLAPCMTSVIASE